MKMHTERDEDDLTVCVSVCVYAFLHVCMYVCEHVCERGGGLFVIFINSCSWSDTTAPSY
jgi:hypothetical protein